MGASEPTNHGARVGMRWLLAALVLLLLLLQIPLWLGEGSVRDVRLLNQAMEEQESENASLRARNQALKAEVADLKSGLDAIEGRARSELGLIKEGETFYHILPGEQGSGEVSPGSD